MLPRVDGDNEQEPEVQGPNSYHWLHGESPPRRLEDNEVNYPVQQSPIVKLLDVSHHTHDPYV